MRATFLFSFSLFLLFSILTLNGFFIQKRTKRLSFHFESTFFSSTSAKAFTRSTPGTETPTWRRSTSRRRRPSPGTSSPSRTTTSRDSRSCDDGGVASVMISVATATPRKKTFFVKRKDRSFEPNLVFVFLCFLVKLFFLLRRTKTNQKQKETGRSFREREKNSELWN